VDEVSEKSALELSRLIRDKKQSVAEAVGAVLHAIKEKDAQIGAFITVTPEEALARAEAVQARIDAGEALSRLAGVPVAVKDNISTKGVKTTCASKMLENYIPVFDATVIEKMEQAGLIIVGKLNMDEFAMGGSCETGFFGPVRNPWDLSRVAGGTSGGSAAAVAGGEVPLALGTDTGGSIRRPCAFCGVTGIKPTYGAVSRHGLIAYASSMDQIGPMGRDIHDCAALLEIISGPDPMDGTCVIQKPLPFDRSVPESLDGLRIGLLRNDDSLVLAAAGALQDAKAKIEEFDMPPAEAAVWGYYAIASAEASSNLAKFDGLKAGHRAAGAKSLSEVYIQSRSEGFGYTVKERIMFGSLVLSSGYYDTAYRKAMKVRTQIKEAYDKLFERFDVILSPVAAGAAHKLGEQAGNPTEDFMADSYTVSVNLAGLPAVALPCGFTAQGLPVGFQLIGKAFSEPLLVRVASCYQNRTDFHTKTPVFEGAASSKGGTSSV
jgi:aspartyl-tRNA(Asn)/glutamyl-tRNA(Gln) amidotransferase subunit A